MGMALQSIHCKWNVSSARRCTLLLFICSSLFSPSQYSVFLWLLPFQSYVRVCYVLPVHKHNYKKQHWNIHISIRNTMGVFSQKVLDVSLSLSQGWWYFISMLYMLMPQSCHMLMPQCYSFHFQISLLYHLIYSL